MNTSEKVSEIISSPETMDTLGLFEDELVKQLTVELMKGVPDYFWKVGASSTKKHHSENERGEGGLWRHTEALCYIAKDLYRSDLFKLTRRQLDLAYLALHLHDTFARGEIEGPHTLTEHPILAAEYVRHHHASRVLPAHEIELICKAIERHMGKWMYDYEGNKVLDAPETEIEKFVHLCDYIGSRKILSFNKPYTTISMD